MWLVMIGIGIFFFLLQARPRLPEELPSEQEAVPGDYNIKTTTTPTELYSSLRAAGLTHKGSLLALAQAMAESLISENQLRTCGHNYWNFGKPSWWDGSHSEDDWWSICKRGEEPPYGVGKTISFIDIAHAVESYIEVLDRSKPDECLNQLFSPEPDIDIFLTWICQPDERWASTCASGEYQRTIENYYNQLLGSSLA